MKVRIGRLPSRGAPRPPREAMRAGGDRIGCAVAGSPSNSAARKPVGRAVPSLPYSRPPLHAANAAHAGHRGVAGGALAGSGRRREGGRLGDKVAEAIPSRTVRDHRVEGLAGVPRADQRVVLREGVVESTTGAVAVGGVGSCSRRLSPKHRAAGLVGTATARPGADSRATPRAAAGDSGGARLYATAGAGSRTRSTGATVKPEGRSAVVVEPSAPSSQAWKPGSPWK